MDLTLAHRVQPTIARIFWAAPRRLVVLQRGRSLRSR